ncbi:transferase [bacterium]|nr:MAG: transferase [bacterium]
MIHETAIIYPGVELGENCFIGEYVVIGYPPRGRRPGELKTTIGKNAVIRPFTIIYAGTVIGDNFQTGKGASIREDNIIGDDVVVGTHSVLEHGNKIGNRVRIHSQCFLELATIEDDVFIGPGVIFTDDPHPPCPRYKECVGGVTVRRLAKIGGGVLVLPGVTIGEGALVGGGSVVTRDVPPFSVVYGNPARVRKRIDELECFRGFYRRVYEWQE